MDHEDTQDASYDDYVKRMRNDGEWGGEFEIIAATSLCGRKVVVYTSDGLKSVRGEGDGPPIVVWYVDER